MPTTHAYLETQMDAIFIYPNDGACEFSVFRRRFGYPMRHGIEDRGNKSTLIVEI